MKNYCFEHLRESVAPGVRFDLADLLGDLFEHGLDSLSLLGRDFRPDHFVLVSESLRPRVIYSVLLDG